MIKGMIMKDERIINYPTKVCPEIFFLFRGALQRIIMRSERSFVVSVICDHCVLLQVSFWMGREPPCHWKLSGALSPHLHFNLAFFLSDSFITSGPPLPPLYPKLPLSPLTPFSQPASSAVFLTLQPRPELLCPISPFAWSKLCFNLLSNSNAPP